MPGVRDCRDKVTTVFFGANVTGYKWKPFVIWPSQNPEAFKHISKHTCQVYYRSNESRMTQSLFQDTLLNCYTSEMCGE